MDVGEVYNVQNESNKKRLAMYKNLSKSCFNKIAKSVRDGHPYCVYNVPAIQIGYPLYNMTQYITYLIKLLKLKSYMVKFIPPNTLFISWGFG